MKENKKWWGLVFLATIILFNLAACEPAELAVEPTTEGEITAETEVEPEDDQGVFDLVYPPQSGEVDMEGALTTGSGLQYLEMVSGEGPSPQDGDIVRMNFIASLPDGTEFGNTYMEGEPVVAVVGRDQLLPGWEEGLRLMKAGGQARLLLPPDLAFGSEGYGMIPPDSDIILVLELLTIEAPPTPENVSESKLITTDSGLQYYDIIVGDGDAAEGGSLIFNHFTIWVQGETEDLYVGSSEGSQPISFEIGLGDKVFPGWEEGATGMKVGGKRLLIIPPELGLGEMGGGDIPPNAVLILEIELMDVSEPVKMTVVDEADLTTTESGLQYYDLVDGVGESPEAGQMVVVHYTGWLVDGTKFDSSLDRGEPFTFQLGTGNVILGWDEGVATMKVGGVRHLVIPPDLAYGETGSGATIPPGATLIFEVELLGIQ